MSNLRTTMSYRYFKFADKLTSEGLYILSELIRHMFNLSNSSQSTQTSTTVKSQMLMPIKFVDKNGLVLRQPFQLFEVLRFC